MKRFLIFLFLFFPSIAPAAVKYDVACAADTAVIISYEYESLTPVLATSNTHTVEMSDTPAGVYMSHRIPAISGSSGIATVVFSSGNFQNFTCVQDENIFTPGNAMFALGVTLAIVFFWGVRTRV